MTMNIRGILEVHRQTTGEVFLRTPDVTDIEIENPQRIWFQTGEGRRIPYEEYRLDREGNESFLGFSIVFVLENEDGPIRLRLLSTRLRHRLAVFRPSNRVEFLLTVILYTLENLESDRNTLRALITTIKALRPRRRIGSILQKSCIRLACIALYLFYDESRVMGYIPESYILLHETIRARATSIANIYFRVNSIRSLIEQTSLCFYTRRTEDSVCVLDVLYDVLLDALPVFYIPLNVNAQSTTRWLSNEITRR